MGQRLVNLLNWIIPSLEIERIRTSVIERDCHHDSLKLPAPKGERMLLSEKIFVPVKENPKYNFVGRILGPRGMTAKQLVGHVNGDLNSISLFGLRSKRPAAKSWSVARALCVIVSRRQCVVASPIMSTSIRSSTSSSSMITPNLFFHVFHTNSCRCEDTEMRARIKLNNAVTQIRKLLVPPANHRLDELKRKQLMELVKLSRCVV